MKGAIVHPNKVLIRINKHDRKKTFEKDITRFDGEVIQLITSLEANQGEEASYGQAVQVGDVIGVGANVDWVKEGDRAILDYTVDINDSNVVYAYSQHDKVVCINAISRYHDSDFIIPANKNRQTDQYVYRVGDLDESSMLIGVIRDGVILPNFPYVILAYRPIKQEYIQPKGTLHMMLVEESIISRTVIAVHPQSKLKIGDVIVVESDSLFDRSADEKMMSVVYEHDVLATENKWVISRT